MAWTQSDIDKLKRAMGSGARRAEFGSGETRRVTEFRSLAEMEALLAAMIAEVAAANAPSRTAFVQFDRD